MEGVDSVGRVINRDSDNSLGHRPISKDCLEGLMQPHVNLGIRFRMNRKVSGGGGPGGKGIKKGFPISILAILSSAGMEIQKLPFWKKLYRQGRRG